MASYPISTSTPLTVIQPALTLSLFAPGAGVTSLLSVPRLPFSFFSFSFSFATSSRTGRMLRSAYFRQFDPHVSHSTLVASPFGAFHQRGDVRVRQAPQYAFLPVGASTVEASSSSTC